MKNILFPTAYSAHSKEAFKYAQKLAQYFEAGITMVHIYESPTISLMSSSAAMTSISGDSAEDYEEESWRRAMHKLQNFGREMGAKQFENVPLNFIVSTGDVIEELTAIQEQNQFDLIVMGMSRHSIADKLFGNTTYALIDNLKCPILLVPPGYNYSSIENIIYGTAFELGKEKVIEHLLEWCLAFNANLNVLHVHKKAKSDVAKTKMEELKSEFKEESETGVINFQLLEGDLAKSMEDHRELSGADMLAVHRRKQGFWEKITEGSLTKQLSEKMPIPLLVFKS